MQVDQPLAPQMKPHLDEWTSNHSVRQDILGEQTLRRMASPYCWARHPLHR